MGSLCEEFTATEALPLSKTSTKKITILLFTTLTLEKLYSNNFKVYLTKWFLEMFNMT